MVTAGRVAVGVLAGVLLAGGCKPNLEGRPSTVMGTRVLAIRSNPAEVHLTPGAKANVTYEALYVGADGDLDASELDWASCTARKPISNTGPISTDCLAPSSPELVPLEVSTAELDAGADAAPDGGAPTGPVTRASTSITSNDCGVFGPSPPTPKPGQLASRAADPDPTGGYYQPVRVMYLVDGEPQYAVGDTRLGCGLASSSGASVDIGTSFNQRYHANQNPAIDSVSSQLGPTAAKGEVAGTLHVAPGAVVTFTAGWATCAATADATLVPCSGSEPYVAYDPLKQVLDDRRESMRVSWFATNGTFDHDSTGRTEEESRSGATTSDDAWTAPMQPGKNVIWVVLRDDRGGVDWREVHVDVER